MKKPESNDSVMTHIQNKDIKRYFLQKYSLHAAISASQDWSMMRGEVPNCYSYPHSAFFSVAWKEIPVCEGFSQGCPLLPVLSAIVLNYILTKVDSVLQQRSELRRHQAYSFSDDNLGGRPIIMT